MQNVDNLKAVRLENLRKGAATLRARREAQRKSILFDCLQKGDCRWPHCDCQVIAMQEQEAAQ